MQKSKVLKAILESFPLHGRSLSKKALAQILRVSDITEVTRCLEELEKDDAIVRDNRTGEIIVAYPYSYAETRHRVTIAGRTNIWAMCAIDALGIHFMVRKDTTIESTCPQLGIPITIHLHRGDVSFVEPSTTVVWRTDKRADECHDATTCCPGTNFFSSCEALEQWKSRTREVGGELFTLQRATARGQSLFGHLLQ